MLAAELMMVVYASFSLRTRIGFRNWRRLHWATSLVFAFATLHGLAAGTDSGTTWALALWARHRRRPRRHRLGLCPRGGGEQHSASAVSAYMTIFPSRREHTDPPRVGNRRWWEPRCSERLRDPGEVTGA